MYNCQNYQLNYSLTGNVNKPVILLLHGFMGNSNDFVEVMPQMSQYFSCLTVDLPGHGKTKVTGDDEYYNMPNTALALINLLDNLKIDKCCLFGYSMGGRLALYLAIKFPPRFDKLILESASPGLRNISEKARRRLSDLKLAEQLENGNFPEFLSSWYNQPLFQSLKQHHQFEEFIKRRLNNQPSELAKSLRNLGISNQPSLWEELVNHQIPTLLIVGEFDHKFQMINQEIVQLCQFAIMKSISQSGHNIHWENPVKWTETVIQFCM